MTLTKLALAAILALAKAPAADPIADLPRLEALAADVARGVQDASADNPFTGAAREEAAVLVLIGVAFHESAFDARVQDCRLTGDRMRGQLPHEGPSVTLWQLKGAWARGGVGRDEICARPRLAAAQALRVFGGHARRCARSPWLAAFTGYASGSCGRESVVAYLAKDGTVRTQRAGAVRCRTWDRLAQKAGLVGASCSSARTPISRATDRP
jgi:hypothetical protein